MATTISVAGAATVRFSQCGDFSLMSPGITNAIRGSEVGTGYIEVIHPDCTGVSRGAQCVYSTVCH